MMKTTLKKALAAAALLVAGTASAGVIDFENVVGPTGPFLGHNTFAQDGNIWMAGKSRLGGAANPEIFGGLIVDGTDPFGCFAMCPTGNTSKYSAGVDGGYLMLGRDDGLLQLSSLQAGYVNVDPDVPYTGTTQLLLQGGWFAGGFVNSFLTLNKTGFSSYDLTVLDPNFASRQFDYVFILGLANGALSNDSNFAVDNIAYVPEPGSIALVGLSLAALAAVRRRRQA